MYIDPPYNTESSAKEGNRVADHNEKFKAKKFVYRDKFSRNGWLNMMSERLELAKNLLTEQGVILVSIDDNEHAYLKVLMDEIFGEENFIANFIFAKSKAPKNDKKSITINHEYIVAYARDIQNINIKLTERTENQLAQYQNKDNDPRGPWVDCQVTSPTYRKSTDYEIVVNGKTYTPGKDKSWLHTKNKMMDLIADNRILVGQTTLRLKRFLSEVKEGISPVSIIYDERVDSSLDGNWDLDFIKLFNIEYLKTFLIDKNKTGSAQDGTVVLTSILNNRLFQYPKSLKLLEYLINIFSLETSRILDFYAGSGTTGHAVLALNKKDGGSRTYTLVTNNENKIGEKITYERLYRINKGKGTNNENFPWIKNKKNEVFNSNLDVYRIKYKNLKIDNDQDLDSLIDEVNQMLNDFGILNVNVSTNKILSKLRSLKALGE
ncbi:site-specific DNA-methyltransferase [Mycoplasma sp. 1578d]|uniref:site-specific DNA-methyltransferase n=1 Tax=Mycoplasma sp. 1578d TaxID=2967299 RepID=UPI002795FE47|nr:site-specific DNA-methyltransferase [Mycoplasma sp. 1578d]